MHVFKDKNGLEWRVVVDVAVFAEARDSFGVDLYRVVDDNFATLTRLGSDPNALVGVLYCCCREQAEKAGVSAEAFGRSFDGNAVRDGFEALQEEVLTFSLALPQREAVRALIRKASEVADLATQNLARVVQATTAESLVQKLSAPSGGLPESPGSAPGGSPTGSSP